MLTGTAEHRTEECSSAARCAVNTVIIGGCALQAGGVGWVSGSVLNALRREFEASDRPAHLSASTWRN